MDFFDNVLAGKIDAPCFHCGKFQDEHSIEDMACLTSATPATPSHGTIEYAQTDAILVALEETMTLTVEFSYNGTDSSYMAHFYDYVTFAHFDACTFDDAMEIIAKFTPVTTETSATPSIDEITTNVELIFDAVDFYTTMSDVQLLRLVCMHTERLARMTDQWMIDATLNVIREIDDLLDARVSRSRVA